MTGINLAGVPAPNALEQLDYEAILSDLKAELVQRSPQLAASLTLESEPVTKLLQVFAYRELILRQRVNDAVKAVMLAYATGANLENLGALYGLERLVIDPGDPDAIPPVAPTYESDADFRKRVQLAPFSFSNAGPRGAYIYHALGAHADVKSVNVTSPNPNEINVWVLSRAGDGTPDQAMTDAVIAALNDEAVRPIGDQLTVAGASVTNYTIDATLEIGTGPDAATVLAAVNAAVAAYAEEQHHIGASIRLSKIYKVLMQEGVENATITAPVADIDGADSVAPYMTSSTIVTA